MWALFFWISVRVRVWAVQPFAVSSCCCGCCRSHSKCLKIGLWTIPVPGALIVLPYFCVDGNRLICCQYSCHNTWFYFFFFQKYNFFSYDYSFYGRALFSISFGLFSSFSPHPLFHLNTLQLHGRVMWLSIQVTKRTIFGHNPCHNLSFSSSPFLLTRVFRTQFITIKCETKWKAK